MQKRYDAASDFRARFTQTLTSTAMGRKTNSAGGVMFKKPGRMRWDYDKPEKATYVSDGGVLWLYEPEDQQAFKQELKASQLPAALAFLTGKGKLAAEFDITAGGQERLRHAGRLPAVAVTQGGRAAGEEHPLRRRSEDLRRPRERHHRRAGEPQRSDVRRHQDEQPPPRVASSTSRRPPGVRVIDTAKLGK